MDRPIAHQTVDRSTIYQSCIRLPMLSKICGSQCNTHPWSFIKDHLAAVQKMLGWILHVEVWNLLPENAVRWHGLGITSFVLIIYYNNARSLRAGILTIITNCLGHVFILLAIILIIDTGDWLPIHNKRDWSIVGQVNNPPAAQRDRPIAQIRQMQTIPLGLRLVFVPRDR